MSASPTIFRSTDAGAPLLTGTPGSLAALLDAVLVDGYGSGGDEKLPLGWIRSFSSGHKRVYRNDQSVGATGYFIRFDDSGDLISEVSAYESMTDSDTGINAFDATTTSWQKSIAANTTPRDWTIVGNDRCVYLFIRTGTTNVTLQQQGWFFGDLNMLGVTDVFGFAYSLSWSTGGIYVSGLFTGSYQPHGMRAARSYTGDLGGVKLTNANATLSGQDRFGGSGALPYPYPTTNGVVLSRVIVQEGVLMRATLPGLWIAEHSNIHDDDVIYDDFIDLPPGTQLLCKIASPAALAATTACRGLLDLTNPWY